MALAAFWWLTTPETINDTAKNWIAKPGDLAKGETIFWAGGCASCHAAIHGTSPEGRHYYPAFPYTSYSAMSYQDVKHLWTYLQTLEPIATENKPHDLAFPFNISRGIGLWNKIPNITPHETGIGSWSQEDIVYYLESGFTPDYDSVGGTMVDVQQNMAKLPKSDLSAKA